jgi:clan AA aspartic protease (TIGR02281 family)
MTSILADYMTERAGGRRTARWPQIAAATGAALLLMVPSSLQAADLGSLIGGAFGSFFGVQQQQQQQQYYQQQQRYQQQLYQQQLYQRQLYNQEQQRDRADAARRRQVELRRQKDQKAKADKQQEANVTGTSVIAGPFQVYMKKKDGNLWVPAQINNAVKIDFVIDSGASDITLPWDTYLTLIRSGTLTKANYIGEVNFGIANGSEVRGHKFKLATLQVGNQVLTDVVASVMPSDAATPLLGLSFLSRFQSWSIDNKSSVLTLVPLNANPAGGAATQLAASATAQPLPAFGTIAPPAAQSPSPAVVATAQPQAGPGTATAPQTSTISQIGAVTSPPQSEPAATVAPAPQGPAATAGATSMPAAPSAAMPTPAPGRQLLALDKPRSGLASSSVFLATTTPTTAPLASATTTTPPTTAPATAMLAPAPSPTAAGPAPAPPAGPTTTAAVATPPLAKSETAGQVLVFPASTAYAAARVDLMALGYGPAPMPDAGKCDSTSDTTCFPERMACVKTDAVMCDFLWRRGEQVIRVRTAAIPPTVSSVECQVNCK